MVAALPALMFVTLAMLIFTGFPVAFVLAGVGIGFGFIANAVNGGAILGHGSDGIVLSRAA
ncbi:hypothetical protein SAMN05216196_107183 [Lutimaribacter pacificus]|uniref:Uncharacterized protein n=2 Tax=Lutimaribacter pacificus TaxID=391948 RepID=A0A1H0LAA4_9RHOB|nr:hypothetical protein SAMN05216196_107183 [Lutimaribacter pacificus]SHK69592.1 hypothetical protein SAMN05444142_1081 [Lutimaribacter pacificus]